MQAVILAGGEGKRLRPLTRSRPKALIPVANRPIIEHVIESLRKNGIGEIIVVVGYRKEQVIRYLNSLDIPVDVVVQERQLGTAHALRCAEGSIHGDFLLLPGDNYIDPASVGRIMNLRNAMLVKEHTSPSNFGVVVIRDGQVSAILEKPEEAPAFTVSTGIFSLTPEIFRYNAGNDLTDSIGAMLESGVGLRAIEALDWQDAIYPWDLLSMNERLIRGVAPGRDGKISREAVITGPVRFGKDTTIGPHAVIAGPVVMGEGCEIGSHTVIGPNTSIGSRVKIGPFTMISGSVIMDDVVLGSHSKVTGAVIGERCVLPDHQDVRPVPRVIEIDGHLTKAEFGGIFGDAVSGAPFTSFGGTVLGNGAGIRKGHLDLQGMDIPDEAQVV